MLSMTEPGERGTPEVMAIASSYSEKRVRLFADSEGPTLN